MSNSVNMCVRVDAELKAQAEEILDQLGMNLNGTINMFLKQIVREKKVPLNLSLINEKEYSPDYVISQENREDGVDGRVLLEMMKKVVSEAETQKKKNSLKLLKTFNHRTLVSICAFDLDSFSSSRKSYNRNYGSNGRLRC